MNTEYRQVADFPNYKLGSDGTLWSKYRWPSHYERTTNDALGDEWYQVKMAPKQDTGYITVCLYNESRRRYVRVHCLMLETFVGKRPERFEACHWNGNRLDNRIENLRWDTRRNNQLDKYRHGTIATGERNPMSKLTNADVIEIRRTCNAGERCNIVAKRFGVKTETVSNIVNRKTWRHIA